MVFVPSIPSKICFSYCFIHKYCIYGEIKALLKMTTCPFTLSTMWDPLERGALIAVRYTETDKKGSSA